MALDVDGRVWAWGFNIAGQLGDGTAISRPVPVQVVGLRDVVAVSAGSNWSMALRADGTVWTWGGNDNGQLGDGTLVLKHVPVQALGPGGPLADITAISASAFGEHGLALRVDGTVWAWGANVFGELGDGTLTQRKTAVPVQTAGTRSDLHGIAAIAAGGLHSLALGADGRVWAWGRNNRGQVGDDTVIDHLRAVLVRAAPGATADLRGVIAIAGGAQYSVALLADCSAMAWGLNSAGQLGDGTTQNRLAPVFMLHGPKKNSTPQRALTAIAAGAGHTLVVGEFTQTMAWGNNDHGQLGDGSQTTREFPVEVMPPQQWRGAKAIAAGNFHSLAIRAVGAFPPPDGTVFAWGANASGQLGDNPDNEHNTPFPTPNTDNTAFVDGGAAYSVALLADGTVLAWGDNNQGQLSLGYVGSISVVPGSVRDPVEPDNRIQQVIAVAAGRNFCLALKVDGTVWGWGANEQGQLGDGTTESRALPVQVRGAVGDGFLTGVKAIAAGATQSVALKADGTVWAWGGNARGQVGDGTLDDRVFPVLIRHLPTDGDAPPWAIAIAAGDAHSLLVLARGHVRAWGANDRGQLGQDTPTDQPLPIRVLNAQHQADLDGVKAIAGGGQHSLALHAVAGGISAWGSNSDGQLGTGAPGYSSRPELVLDDSGNSLRRVGAIAAGAAHSLGLRWPSAVPQR
jgi:alpha-tubulin suppressor-like RCC1 family protein